MRSILWNGSLNRHARKKIKKEFCKFNLNKEVEPKFIVFTHYH